MTALDLLGYNYAIFAFVLGSIVGSFLNVVILRVPENREILGREPSACPTCGTQIKWYDNIPIISYVLLLRGKCRKCKTKISWQYPIVEFITGCVFLILYFQHSFSYETYILWFFSAALIAIIFIDIRHYIIPDLITYPGMVIALICAAFMPDIDLVNMIIGLVVGGSFFLIAGAIGTFVMKKEAMGGGDVKMAAMMGAFLGWKPLLVAMALAVVICAIYAIVLMITRKANSKCMVPFGPFLAFGSFYVIFLNYAPVFNFFFPYLPKA